MIKVSRNQNRIFQNILWIILIVSIKNAKKMKIVLGIRNIKLLGLMNFTNIEIL